jgi:uncharacterized membrane protein YfcA
MTPILILLLGVQPSVAVGSDLAYSAITKIVGSIQHARQKTIDYKLAGRLALGSAPGSLIGVWLVHHLQRQMGKSSQELILRLLGVMLILVAAAIFVRSHPKAARWERKLNSERLRTNLGLTVTVGAVFGFLVGITSVGSGTMFGVVMLLVFGLGAREVVGTDVFHAALLTSVAAFGHIIAHNVNYSLVGSLLTGSIPGVLLGSRASVRLPEKALRPVLAGVLLLSGLKMI